MKDITKTIFLLNIGDYPREITDLTYPFIRFYAERIGAEIVYITKRKFPAFPPTYEKLQIYEMAQNIGSDWNIYIDSDALIHVETVDYTEHIPKDTIAHYGIDNGAVRWKGDSYFLRDGRFPGSTTWLVFSSDWCLDLWHPLEDMSAKDATKRVYPVLRERRKFITPQHLLDDYTLSRNIARYGLKYTSLFDVNKRLGLPDADFFWHKYELTTSEKIAGLKETINRWGMAGLSKR